MNQCTAPKEGHKPNSTSEKTCPVHGIKYGFVTHKIKKEDFTSKQIADPRGDGSGLPLILGKGSSTVGNGTLTSKGEEGTTERKLGKAMSNVGLDDHRIYFADRGRMLNTLSNLRRELRAIDSDRKDWGPGTNELIALLDNSISSLDKYSDKELKNIIITNRNIALQADIPKEIKMPDSDSKLSYESAYTTPERRRNIDEALSFHYGLHSDDVTLTRIPDDDSKELPNSVFKKGTRVQIGGDSFDVEPGGNLSVDGRLVENIAVSQGIANVKMMGRLKSARTKRRAKRLLNL